MMALAAQTIHFYPRPPRGGRHSVGYILHPGNRKFLSTSPAWGTTRRTANHHTESVISIHVPRVGDDIVFCKLLHGLVNFYPRPPRGGRHSSHVRPMMVISISIHVPRVGDDGRLVLLVRFANWYFYPRPPRGGRRYRISVPDEVYLHFYPRPPRGGRPTDVTGSGQWQSIFLSTSPAWGTTKETLRWGNPRWISIHVPRVGDDSEYLSNSICRCISIHVPRVGDDSSVMPSV